MSVELIGPITDHVLIVNGRQVPFITARPRNGGVISMTLDNRLALDVPVADFDRIASFVADCIAVGMGYTAHPLPEWDGPVRRSPFPRWTDLTLPGALA